MSNEQKMPQAAETVHVSVEWQMQRFPFAPDEEFDGLSDEAKVKALFGFPELAQELYDSGLLFLVNQAVLHNYGYALGVDLQETTDENGEKTHAVIGLTLHKSSDPEGIWFDEEGIKVGRRKLLASGLIAGAARFP